MPKIKITKFLKLKNIAMKKIVVHQLLDHAVITYPNQQIISGLHRLTFLKFCKRVIRLAKSIKELGIKNGIMVGVLDVNSHRFLEMHFVLSKLGAIIYTINFRLLSEQMIYPMVHTANKWDFVSDVFDPMVKPLFAKFPKWVLLSDNVSQLLPTAKEISKKEFRDLLQSKVNEGKIAKFWIPDSFIFVDEIPLTSAGKPNKQELRNRYQ